MHALYFAKRSFAILVFIAIAFWFSLRFAHAPSGDKNALGGRTIASVQEEEFDKKLERLEVCYGAQFGAKSASIDRRRTCKAIVVKKLRDLLQKPGTYLSRSVRMECQDSMRGQDSWREWDDTPVFALRPNHESAAMKEITETYVTRRELASEQVARAEGVCDRVLHCHQVLKWSNMEPLEAVRCAMDIDPLRRRIILDMVAEQLFHVPPEHPALMSELLGSP